MIRNGALNRLADPPRRVRRELVATAPVELLDGAVEAERSLLNQIEERHAQAAIALCDRDDKAEVRLDHAPFCKQVTALDRFRESDFLVSGEQFVAADVRKEELQRVARARRLVGLVHDLLGLDRLFLGGSLANFEPDAFQLARQLFDVDVGELVLERERLELGRLDIAALLARLDQALRAFGFQQFGELVLRQSALTRPFVESLAPTTCHRTAFLR